MPTVVDQLVTEYIAVDRHSGVAERVARSIERLGRATDATGRTTLKNATLTAAETRATERHLRVAERAERVITQEARTREQNAKVLTAEVRAREAVAKAIERQEKAEERLARASRAGSFGSKFKQGFGSTRFDFGAASPLFSSFSRGGFAGGVGALTATGLAGGAMGIGNLFKFGAGMIGQGVGAIPGFAGSALDAAQARESREARLRGLIGPQRAAGALKAAEGVAAPSPFTTSQLSDAAVQLEAFGVRAERALPIIGRLGTAMGAGTEQLDMYTKAIGELGTGNMIDKDVLAAMGLTRADFQQQGIQFDGNGQLLSSAEQTLDALDRIVRTRYAGVLDAMGNTIESKRASLNDAGEKAMVEIGKGVARAEGPFVDRLTRLLTGAVDSGQLADTVNRTLNSLQRLTGTGSDAGMANFAATILTTVELIPEYLRIAIQNGQEWWRMMEGGARRWGTIFAAQWTYGLKMAENFGNAANSLTKNPLGYLTNPAGPVAELGKRVGSATYNFGAQARLAAGARDTRLASADLYSYSPQYAQMPDFGKRRDEIAAKLASGMKGASTPGFPDAPGNFLTRQQSAAEEKLDSIKDATERTAKNTDPNLNDVMFGGVEAKRRGISFADLNPSSAKKNGVKISVDGSDEIAAWIRKFAEEVAVQTMREFSVI